MKRLKLLPLVLSVLMLVSCAPVDGGTPSSPTEAPGTLPAAYESGTVLSVPTYPKAIGYEDYEAQNAAHEEIDENYLAGVRTFLIKSATLSLSDTEGKNALVSPASLFFALAMATEGAGGATKEQLLSALGTDEALLKSETAKLFRKLYFDNEVGSFKAYNSAWLDGRADFDEATLQALADSYYAACIAADFTGTAYKKQIADWIYERTNGLLGGDPSAFEVDPATLMLLINTLYYKDQWISQFSEENTSATDFYNADGSSVSFDFLNGTRSGKFQMTDAFLASSLQLKNGSIRFVLPNEGVSPEDIVSNEALFLQAVDGTQGETGYGEVVWQIPKFNYSVELDLSDTLKALGITDAFDSEKADFSSFTQSEKLFLGGVKQGSKIALDENGIEAASYTEISFVGTALPTDRAEMVLDRPFLYIVYVGDMPVFVGIVNNLNG